MYRHLHAIRVFSCGFLTFSLLIGARSAAQTPPKPTPAQGTSVAPPAAPKPAAADRVDQSVTPPPDYVIGPDDILTVKIWGQSELSGDFTVRPDGKITLLLVNEVQAAGLTPEQLRLSLTTAVGKFYDDPTITVNAKQINSRKVYIVGNVAKPGEYPLLEPITVVMLITKAGGLLDWADKKNIVILSRELQRDGTPVSWKFNYEDIASQKNLKQNRELRPGDQVIVR